MVVVLFAALFLLQGWARFGAPFGRSHDGFNGAVWGTAARAIREDGLWESRLGAVRRTTTAREVYANHPPLIAVESALAETVGGEREGATRAPAVLSSVAAVVLAYALLVQLGITPLAAALGVVVAFGCSMFFVYGGMLDTPVTSFWLAPLLLLVAHRACSGGEVPRWQAAVLPFVAAVSGWEAALMAAVVGAWLVLRRPTRAVGLSWLAGLAGGACLDVAWMTWATGGLGEVAGRARFRAGLDEGGSFGAVDFLVRQHGFARQSFGAWWFVSPAIAAAGLLSTRTRVTMALSLLVVVGYASAFRNAAYLHSYWNFWLLLPAAIGIAVLLERGLRIRGWSPVTGLAAAAVALGLVLGALRPSAAERSVDEGIAVGRTIRAAAVPDDQEQVYAVAMGRHLPFVSYYTRRQVVAADPAEAVALAASHPRHLVLSNDTRSRGGLRLSPAADLRAGPSGDVGALRHAEELRRLDRLVREEPHAAWLAVLAAARTSGDPGHLCDLGAGPLRALVRYRGEALVPDLESEAPHQGGLRAALGCLWLGDEPVRARIEALLREPEGRQRRG